MRALGRILSGIWSFIVDLCVDGYGAITFIAPILSVTFTLAKFYEVPMTGLKDLSYAWGLLPITIWFFVAYVRRRAMNRRRRAVKQLRDFYTASDELAMKKVGSDEELAAYAAKTDSWVNLCAKWIQENIGMAARSRFLDRTGMMSASVHGAFNEQHNSIILSIARLRKNLALLIETDAWDD